MDTYPRNQKGYILLTDKETLYRYTAAVLNMPPHTIDPHHYNFSPLDHQNVYLRYKREMLDIADRRALDTIARLTGKPCPLFRDYLKKDNTCGKDNTGDTAALFLLLVILFIIAFLLSLPLFA